MTSPASPASDSPSALGAVPVIGGPADNRAAMRRNVTWRARLMQAHGAIFEAKTVDISVAGVGLIAQQPLPASSVVQLALQVPHLTIPGNFTVITGRVKVAFQVIRGDDYRIGAQWVELSDANRMLLSMWAERLPGKSLE